ncbi:unnamed protein product [Closterium sp. NIES-54]
MVRCVVDTGVVDTLEARLENARRRHEANEYGDLPWAVVEAGIRAVWGMEHPPRLVSPQPLNTEGGVDTGVNAGGQVSSSAGGTSRHRGVIHADEVGGVEARGMRSSATAGSSQGDLGGRRSGLSPMSATHMTAGGIAPSYDCFKFTPNRILVTPLLVGQPDILTWKEAIEPQLEMAGLIGFARGTVATLEDPDLRAEFCTVQLLTFTVISWCCSLGVQIALNSCREHLDASHRAWHFIESTYQVTNDLFIGHLEGQLTHPQMGNQETPTDYCNRARRILATIRMAGAQYSTASYVTHIMQGLPSNYNLLKRLSMASSTRATLNEDTLTSYILQDEAMQEAECLAAVVAVVGSRPRTQTRGSRPRTAVEEEESRCRGCWLCGDPDHLSFECPNRSDSDDDNANGGHGNSGSRRPRRGGNKPRKEKQSTKLTSAMDAESSAHPGGGPARQRLLASPDGDKGRLRRLGAEWRCQARARLQRGTAGRPEPGHGRLARSPTPLTEIVALRAIVSATKSTTDRLHVRLAHVGMNTIRSSAKHEVATGLDLKSASGVAVPCVSCVGGKLARHTFPDQGSDADDVLAVMHVDLCGPFQVDAKDGSLYLTDRKTRYVWVRPVRNCLERSTLQPGTTPCQLLTKKKPDLSLARVWDCMAQFLVPEQQRGGKLKPKASWGLHLGVSEDSKDWELLNIADNRVVTTSDVVFYENMSLDVWKSEHGPASGRTPTTPPTDASTATLPLLAEVGELAAEDVEDVPSPFPSPSPTPLVPPLVADLRRLTPASASDDEGSSGASPKAPSKSIAGGRRDVQQVDMRVMSTQVGEEQTKEVQPTMAGEYTDSDVVEVQGGPRHTGRLRRPPDFFFPAAFTTVYDVDADDPAYDNTEDDDELLELDPDMHTDPEHRWDISTMMVKEAQASWKGVAVKVAMEEEIRSLIGMGTWELVERPL